MNRPIKFKAWNLKESTMHEVAWIKYANGQDVSDVGVYWNDGHHNGATRLDAKDVVLRRYSGLKDKNSLVDIYEGDIIDVEGNLVSNIYESPQIYKKATHLIIEGLGTKEWRDSEAEAILRGCRYA